MKIPTQFISKNIAWLLPLVAFGIILYFLLGAMLKEQNINFYLNPDFNTYPYMARNVIYQHGSYFLWSMGTAPYFIPELSFLYLTTLVFKDPYTNLLLYGLFQSIYFCIITITVFAAATKSKTGFRLGILSVLIFFWVIFQKHMFNSVYGDYAYLSAIFAPGFHFGAALLSFTALFLILKNLSTPKTYLKIILTLLLFLAGLSDSLTYLYFSLPMIATISIYYFFNRDLHLKEYISLMIILIITLISSFIVYHLLPFREPKLTSHISFQLSYLLSFIYTICTFIRTNHFGGILWLAFMILAPFSLWYSFSKKDNASRLIDYVILFQFATVIITTPLIMLALQQILPPGYDVVPTKLILSHPIQVYNNLENLPFRYLINYFVGPTCFGLPLLLYKHTRGFSYVSKNSVYASLLIACTLIIISVKPTQLYKNNLFTFQPPFAACFNQAAKKYNLTHGMANSYFDAALINAYNTSNAHVALVSDNLTPIMWQNTLQQYQYTNYNFVLSDSNSIEKTLIQRFGKPTATVVCTENNKLNMHYIFVYNNGKIKHF